MTTDDDLVHALGCIDAAFAPVREYGNGSRLSPNAWIAREDYPATGMPWFGGGGSVNERKGAEKRLGDLEDAGYVRTHRQRGRTAGVFLTPAGEARARALAGLPTMTHALVEVLELAARQKREPEYHLDKWIPETALAGVEWGYGNPTKPFVHLEERLLPALVAGLVRFGTTSQGHCYYTLTSAGWQAVDDGVEPPAILTGVEEDADLRGRYYDAFKAARVRMQEADVGRVGEIGPIPLPVSMGNLKLVYQRAST